MPRKKSKTKVINGHTYYYETIELPRKANGKRNIKQVYAKTVGELKEKLSALRDELKNDIDITANHRFIDLFTPWLYEIKLKNKKPSTIDKYEGLYNKYIKGSTLKDVKIKTLKSITIQHHYNSLEKNGTTPNTIKQIHKLIKPFLEYLYRENYTIRDYGHTGMIVLPKIETNNNTVTVLTVEEQTKFIESLDGNKDRLIFLFALCTGLRVGELLALKWKDINMKDATVQVSKNIKRVKVDGKYTIIEQSTPKTKKSNRVVPIPQSILRELKLHKLEQNKLKVLIGNMYNDNNIVFATETGTYIDGANINKRFRKSLTRADIEPIKFHSLRHTYATRLFELGESPKTVSELLGHSDIQTTLNIYTHVTEESKNVAINKFDNMICHLI